jgi:hypothetical protein
MPKNSESLNRSLFDLLHSKGFDPTMLDTSGKEIPTPEEAEVFQFNFVKDGENYGKVTISVDGLHKLVIYFSDDIANSEKEESHGEDESWYKVLNQLKRFAQRYQLSFELRNVDNLKHDMAKREYMKKQERISEGYYPMGKKASYNDAVPNVKIVLQHTRQIEEGEQRYRNIAKIFLENSEGERFLAPTIKPGIARVYGRLIAEGDKPHGDRWNHVTSLVEEYQKMGAFVRATRNGQFNESAQRLVNEGVNHYQGLRETLSKMTGHRGYNAYFESWTPSLMEEESEETNLNELFVQETLDPRIESVMPILSKLQKKVAEMKEVGELSEWADSLLEAPGAETLKHNDDTEEGNLKAFDLAEDDDLQEPAIDELEEDLDEGILDTVKKVGGKVLDKLGHGSDAELLKKLQKDAGIPAQHGKPNMAKPNEKEVDESALQAYLGDKKYGKDGMDALRKAGQEHASEKKMQNIRAKYSNKEEVAEDGEFAGDYATGEAGQWRNKGPKANKPATIGDLVGESQLAEMDKSEDKKGPEGKATPITPKKMADDAKKVLAKQKVKEGQEDLDVIKRLISK